MYKKRAMGWWILYFECCAESLSSGSISSKISNYKDTPMCKLWWLTSHYTRLFDILCLVPHAVQVFLKESDESQKKTAFKFATTTMRNVMGGSPLQVIDQLSLSSIINRLSTFCYT